MDIKERISIHNRFDVEVIDARTGELKRKAVGYNKILNQLYTRLLSNFSNGGYYFRCIFYGSGSGTPAATDTSLFHHEGAIQATTFKTEEDFEHGITSMTRTIQLDEQTAVGVEITEVGIGYDTTSSHLCTHAMLQDMNGNPISIEKTDTDIINIYSTVYIHWGAAKFAPYLLKKGYSYAYPGNTEGALYNWIWGVEEPQQGGIGLNTLFGKEPSNYRDSNYSTTKSNMIDSRYVEKFTPNGISGDAANKRLVLNVPRVAVGEGNIAGGISHIWVGTGSAYGQDPYFSPQLFISVEDNLPGSDITNEAVGTGDGSTTEFSTDYDFPSNLKVYIDGVQTTNFTLRDVPATNLGIHYYCRPLRKESTLARLIDSEQPIYADPSYSTVNVRRDVVLYNRAYGIGFNKIRKAANDVVKASNDLENWVVVAAASDTEVNLTGAAQNYKFWILESSVQNNSVQLTYNSNPGKNIVFDNAPANGSVITADYHTPYIAKDADHVFDFKITWQFGEYTE